MRCCESGIASIRDEASILRCYHHRRTIDGGAAPWERSKGSRRWSPAPGAASAPRSRAGWRRKERGWSAPISIAEPLERTIGEITASGGSALALAGDVTAPEFAKGAIDCVIDAFGGLDILVNNAGYVWNTTIQNTTDEQWEAMLDVHLTAPFRLLRVAAEYFRDQSRREAEEGEVRRRKVVNISSLSGLGR